MPQLTQFVPTGFVLLSAGQKILKIIAIFLASIIAKKTIKLATRKWKKSKKEPIDRVETLANLIKNTGTIIINFTLLLLILSELGFNIVPLITGAGIIGLAVGYGAKDIAADFIVGFFILLENRFNVGDKIEVKSAKGTVTNISLRTTTIEDKEGNTHIIPNSTINTITKF